MSEQLTRWESNMDAGGAQSMNAVVPVLLPKVPIGSDMEISADGYASSTLRDIQGEGLYVVTLQPIKRLWIETLDSSFLDLKYNLVLSNPGKGVIQRFFKVSAPTLLSAEVEVSGLVEVSVSPAVELGIAPVTMVHEVELLAAEDTHVMLDLAVSLGEHASGQLSLVVETSLPLQAAKLLEVALLPRGTSTIEVAVNRLPKVRLSEWRVSPGGLRFERVYHGILPGDYEAVLIPSGPRVPVTVVADNRVEAILTTPNQATLRVWAVDSEGRSCSEALHMGAVAWKRHDENARAREAADPAYPKGAAAEIIGADFVLKHAQLARVEDGSWVIDAPMGVPIVVQFLGPAVLQAEVLTLTLSEGGPQEKSMRFRGL